VRKPAALARFRIAAQALYRFKARPVTSVPSELNVLEQELSALEAGGDNVVVQYLLEQVMYLHFVLLAAFFMESQPAERAIVIVIIHFEFQDCANSGKTVEHRGNKRPVSQS
jgi:hypothetical protein